MLNQIQENIYRLQIPLPKNPLKYLNSYIITSEERNLIIDTGFNIPECLEALQNGINSLGLDMNRTDVLATHLHADHTGLIPQIITKESKVYIGEIDKLIYEKRISDIEGYWANLSEVSYREGYPMSELTKSRQENLGAKFSSDDAIDFIPLRDGEILSVGEMDWNVILTPGHTPGHICLYNQKQKIMVTGDHVLFDITPNITLWDNVTDSLGSYMKSLKQISEYDVQLTLTGHRENIGSFNARIKELLEHHNERLQDILEILRNNPNISGYEVASLMQWSIKAKGWDDFPSSQKWFAVGEALAHLNHLIAKNKIQRILVNGINTYVVNDFLDSDFARI